MSGQTWTPAPKKGVIPLHPMTFGTILSRAFAALRHNPKVLFGFAVIVEFVVTVVTTGVMLLVGWFVVGRIASVPVASPDYWPVFIGSVALGALAAVVMALAAIAFTSVVQGLVAADVSYAALSQRAPLRVLWRRVKPAFWRLFSYSLLQGVAVLLWIALVFGAIVGILAALGPDSAGTIALTVGVGLLLALGSVPLYVWLTTKLLVVPAVLMLEGASLRSALVRSWRLIRGRFWPAFGVMFLIGLIMNIAMQVVALPASIVSGLISGVLVPTGADEPTQVIAIITANVLPQVLVLAVQAIAIVVQGTGATLIYIDSRMRYEGLDQTLIRHVELAAQGTPDEQLDDPFVVDPARAVAKNPPPVQTPTPPPYPAQYPGQYPYPAPYPGQYPAPYPAQYPAQGGYQAPGYSGYPAQPATQQPGYPPPPASAPPAAAPAAAPPAAEPAEPVEPDSPASANPWTPPGDSA
ncbi:hypothetical protein [Microbacterium suwonense]|uniref:Glycerophosphoryl diester phosphodiesterase membrane domain-containing protein n=1 Tax=Microbacterium suwonense TaxID=683047 RepID=A0ABM8FSU8_9MICO|nr:hypothetical protein [Microbacterium suwonense]BDZ38747.1 hypothetical protein GCM10025863_13610 [Microbacterium suwonense]